MDFGKYVEITQNDVLFEIWEATPNIPNTVNREMVKIERLNRQLDTMVRSQLCEEGRNP